MLPELWVDVKGFDKIPTATSSDSFLPATSFPPALPALLSVIQKAVGTHHADLETSEVGLEIFERYP